MIINTCIYIKIKHKCMPKFFKTKNNSNEDLSRITLQLVLSEGHCAGENHCDIQCSPQLYRSAVCSGIN